MNYLIAQIVVGLPLEGPFDYLIPEHLQGHLKVGERVLCVFARKKIVGIVVGFAQESSLKHLNTLIKILDDQPIFNQTFLNFAKEFALRFGCSTGEALFLSLPKYLRQARLHQVDEKIEASNPIGVSKKELWIKGLGQERWDDVLKKVSIYIQKKQKVLVLVPDVSMMQEAMKALACMAKGGVGVVLRQGSEKQEYEKWNKITTGNALLAVGFISSVMTPIHALGLIVVMDEQSPSYKSERSPFYHAADVALLRAQTQECDLVFVSHVPSVARWVDVQEKKMSLAYQQENIASVRLIDISNFKMKKNQWISPLLSQEIEKVLQKKEKIFFYIQASRGVSDVIKELKERFPKAIVIGFDKENSFLDQQADIIVGTQIIFRERSSFRPCLSVILDVDWELYRQDHQAGFLAFALMRTLQYMSKESVILQTRHPQESSFLLEGTKDINVFYQQQALMLKEAHLPPFGVLVAVVVRSLEAELSLNESKRLYDTMKDIFKQDIDVWEPQADRTPLLRGKFRYVVMISAKDTSIITRVSGVLRAFRAKKNVTITMNVNP